jgi:hypothetical protein
MSFSRTWSISVVTLVLTMSPPSATVAGTYLADVDSSATFLDRARLRDWLADGERGLWIQAVDLSWFYARFAQPERGGRSRQRTLHGAELRAEPRSAEEP